MRKMLVIGALCAGLLGVSMPAHADKCSDSVNMMGIEDQSTRNSMISLCREKAKVDSAAGNAVEILSDPDKVEDIKEIMTHVADTISELADRFSVGVNEFVKTPVGLGMAIMTFAYFAGNTVLSLAIGIPLMFLSTFIFWKAMRIIAYERVQIGEGPIESSYLWGLMKTQKLKFQTILRSEWSDNRFGAALGSAILYCIAMGIILGTMVL